MENFKVVTTVLNGIQNFDGSSGSLINFLGRIDSIIPVINTLDANIKLILIGMVKDKIVGNARKSLLKYGDLNNWSDIKNALKREHGEKDSTETIIDKIRTSKCIDTVENFHKRISGLLTRLNAKYILDGQSRQSTVESNARIAFESFKYGLPEPVRSVIISRNPDTLSEAYDIIQANGYRNYRKYPVRSSNEETAKSNDKVNKDKNSKKYNNDSRSGVRSGSHNQNNYRPRSDQSRQYGNYNNPDNYGVQGVEPMDISLNQGENVSVPENFRMGSQEDYHT